MSVDPTPPFNGYNRAFFIRSADYPPRPFEQATTSNYQQLGGSFNMGMAVQPFGPRGTVDRQSDGLVFVTNPPQASGAGDFPDSPGITQTGDWTFGRIPGVLYDETFPGVIVNGADAETFFWVSIAQDPNGGRYYEGLGMTFENDVFEETFSGTCASSGPGDDWVWTSGGGSTSTASVTASAPSVNWSLFPDYRADIKCAAEHQLTTWEATFNYELRTGWFDPSVAYYYATTASVTIRQYIGKGGTSPTYDEPAAYDPLSGQVGFSGTAIATPRRAYL